MRKKRTLTKQRHTEGAYWQIVLGSCEQLLLDLGNLAGKRGRTADHIAEGHVPDPGATDDPDPAKCQRFRDTWSHRFLGLDDTNDYELLNLRYLLRGALIHGDSTDLEALAIRMANRPGPRMRPKGGHLYFDFHLPDGRVWKAPMLFDFPRALAAALVQSIGKGRKLVCCPQCGRCAIGRSHQRFCPGGKCRRAWHRHQPGNIAKWREYMRDKMREYRAEDKRRNQTNLKLSRGKHAKAT